MRVQYYHWKFWASVFGHKGHVDTQTSEDESRCARDELLNGVDARITDDKQTDLDDDLKTDEFVTAIKSMSPYKAPGHDGIPAKVYQLDPELFARILVIVFDDHARRGELSTDQRRSLACLLFKKGERCEPGNFRPICLIPVDVKIFARVLTNRLRPVMPGLIHPDQAGFVKGRHIQHPLLMLYDLQESYTRHDLDAYAVLIDFEKAYDRVTWEYLWAVMRHFGIGERFVQWVRLMYTATEIQLIVNGHILDPIRPSRGVKQGDPLSPLLFLLTMEPLCCAIRHHADLGLHLPQLPPATGQLDIVQRYCAASGAKLNINKTTILPLNRARQQHAPSRLRVLGPNDHVRYLGLPVGQKVFHNDRLAAIDAKFFAQFSIWKWRAKTLQGRTIIASTLMASQLWYCSTVTSIPKSMIANWQRALNSYIVRAQTEPSTGPLMIASEWLYTTPGRTTLRLPNVGLFIQRQRINLLQQLVIASGHQSRPFGWYTIPLQQLSAQHPLTDTNPNTLDFLWMPIGQRRTRRRERHLSPWWCDVLTAWHAWTKNLSVETLPPNDRQRLFLTAPIWCNKYPLWQHQTERSARPQQQLWKSENPTVRRALARNGFSSLQDFLTPDLRWPSLDEFAAMAYCTGELTDPQTRNVAFLYTQLTQVFDRLLPCGVDTSLLDSTRTRIPLLLPWHASAPLKRHWFPHIPSKIVGNALALTRPTPKTRHPFQRHELGNELSITKLRNHATELRKSIDPRTLDVTLRICDPTLRHCTHGCPAIETYRHLFWDCKHSSALWNLVLRQWRTALDYRPSWTQALFGSDLPLTRRWQQHSDGALLAWNITCSIVFTLVWQNRNQHKHQNEPPPNPLSQWPILDKRRRLHIRHALRTAIANNDKALRDDLIRVSSIFATPPLTPGQSTTRV